MAKAWVVFGLVLLAATHSLGTGAAQAAPEDAAKEGDAAPPAQAEPLVPAPGWRSSAETDVFAFFVRGYSLHAALRPPSMPSWRFGFGVFGGDLPGWFVDLAHLGNDEVDGWEVGEDGWELSAYYHFAEQGSTLFVGAYLILMEWNAEHQATGSRHVSSQAIAMPLVGYRWFFADPVFVSFWGGLGVNSPAFAIAESGPVNYPELRLFPFASVHLGYEF